MAYHINPSRFVVSGGSNPVVASLDFDGSTDYLSISDSNFGAFDYAKCAIVLSFRLDTLTATSPIYSKWDAATGGQRSFRLSVGSGGNIIFVASQNGTATSSTFNTSASTIVTGNWYSVLIHYDSAAASADRIKMWLNNSAISASSYTAPTAAMFDGTLGVTMAADSNASQFADGLIYSAAFFSGALPLASDVFDGSAGKLKDLSSLTGLKSLLTGSTAVDDHLLTDWTNHATVTTSGTMP